AADQAAVACRPRGRPHADAGNVRCSRRRPGTTKGPDAEASGPFDQSWSLRSLDDLGDLARADRTAALADREAEALLHRDRLDELDRHVGGVARHDHLGA